MKIVKNIFLLTAFVLTFAVLFTACGSEMKIAGELPVATLTPGDKLEIVTDKEKALEDYMDIIKGYFGDDEAARRFIEKGAFISMNLEARGTVDGESGLYFYLSHDFPVFTDGDYFFLLSNDRTTKIFLLMDGKGNPDDNALALYRFEKTDEDNEFSKNFLVFGEPGKLKIHIMGADSDYGVDYDIFVNSAPEI